jgi:hypothetical protein
MLATGLTKIESAIESEEYFRCYHRSVILDVAHEINPEAVVLSPFLEGNEDLLDQVIIPLRKAGYRIVFLPGAPNMGDARTWMKKLLPWGVYCYVFDPVTPEKIVYRINNPGKIKDLPAIPDAEMQDEKVSDLVTEQTLIKINSKLSIVSTCENLNPFKKKYLVDTSGEISKKLQKSHIALWKNDWRILGAKPYKIEGVLLYPMSDLLGPIDERDKVIFMEFIETLLKQRKPVCVIDNGLFKEDLLRLGAVSV